MAVSTGVAGEEAEVVQAFRMAEALDPGHLARLSRKAQSSCQILEPLLEHSLLKDCHPW